MNKLAWFAALLLIVGGLSGCAGNAPASAGAAAPTEVHVTVNNNAPAAAGAPVQPLDLNGIISRMNKRALVTGVHPAAGVWVVCRADVEPSAGMSRDQMLAMAEIRARRDIGLWMNSAVQSESVLQQSEVTVDGKSSVKEVFSSLTKIDSKAFLRSVTLNSSVTDADGTLHAYYYTTGHLVDRSAELEAQIKAAPPGTVQAIGYGIILEGKIVPAKRQAIQSALRSAVEQVMGTTVIGNSQLMDNDKVKSRVVSQTAGAIREYRIIREGQEQENYQVVLYAKVEKQKLLENYTAIARSMGNPGFLIRTQDPDLHYAFSDFLSSLGFRVVNKPEDAAIFVDADCQYLNIRDEHYGEGIQIDLGLSLADAKTEQQYFAMRNVPRLTSTYSGSFHQIRQSAAKKAFKSMRKQLHEKLNKVVLDWVLNGRPVEVVFGNFSGGAEAAKVLADAFTLVPGAKVETYEVKDSKLVFKCSYVGPSADFAEFISYRLQRSLQGPLPALKQVSLSTIEFSF